LRLLAALVFVGALAGCAHTSTANSSQHPAPCSLLTQAQVVSLTGGPVRAAMPTGTGDGCNWAAISGAKVSLLITLQTNQTPALFAEQRQLAVRTSGYVDDIPSVGDEAFAYSAQEGTVQSAEARNGDVGLRVLLTGAGATPESARQGLLEALKTMTT
jgi:hypothetical protein